jgi:alpha-L-fucosidase 2
MTVMLGMLTLGAVPTAADDTAYQSAGATSPLELWYDSPATQWTEALPVGGGRLGAMVFGGVRQARYQFNEDTLWSGGPRSYVHEGAAGCLPQLRELLFANRQREAERMATEQFMSVPIRQLAYQPFGDVVLEFESDEPVHDYRRALDLRQAVATTRYRQGGVSYYRETFASYPDRGLVIRITCDRPGGLQFAASITSPHPGVQLGSFDERTLLMTGRAADARLPHVGTIESKLRLASHLRVLHTDGQVTASAGTLRVAGASHATLVLTAATSFVDYRTVSADPVARSRTDLDALSSKSYERLRADHVADHQELFGRVSIDLGSAETSELPTDQRLLRNAQRPDPQLCALLFQYGRYLMIASSRPGCQPANLQGIWNDQLEPPWDSKYTININTEMNYWLTEACNLSSCGEPLFDAIGELAQSGSETARVHYNAPGWVVHHNFDLWRGTAPINAANHGIWPTGGAWLCQHLWWHYLYTQDEVFLRETAYPLMKGAAEFFASYLVEDPRNDKGWLISGPSNSPEQGGLVMGPTMDHQIIRWLLASTREAASLLDIDQPFAARLAELEGRIAPNQIGRLGQLQEWLEDVDDPGNRHRHVSHLWGVFPGSEITAETPDLLAAARKSLELRGDGGTGWARAWKINLWARMGDAGHAHAVLQGLLQLTDSRLTEYLGGGVYPNLLDAHPPFQIDGNFGATHGIGQMLIQSRGRASDGAWRIELLPTLPAAWPAGSITGMRAEGGFEVDLAWAGGKLTSARLRSERGGKCLVSYAGRTVLHELASGETRRIGAALER